MSEIMYDEKYSSLSLLALVEPIDSDLEGAGKCNKHGYFTLVKYNAIVILCNNIRTLKYVCPYCKSNEVQK